LPMGFVNRFCLTLSTYFNATPYADILEAKINKGLQLLKAIKGLDWGDKEKLLMTYKSHIKPCMDYLGPVWFPSIKSESASINKL
jgi:hypothetical protein